jgi:succinate dehydrogenase flavin-adding protein (antitoxin of CptAB toxin-antitoxin module)
MNPKPLDSRRAKLLYRSKRRGMLEADLLLGQFAERYLPHLTDAQLDRFELLIEQNCADLWRWASKQEPVPPELQSDVTALLLNFHLDPTRS